VTRAKTTAQWRKEVPAYDRAIRAVEGLIANWPGQRRNIVAHIHPDTRVVSIILHGNRADCATADRLLAYANPAMAGRAWQPETFQGHSYFRKVTQR
jgi:hypothetical protein